MTPLLEKHPPGVTLILPTDPVSGLQAASFQSWMESVLRYSDRIVVDLSRVHFMDSAGCGVLLWVHKQIVERGGRLALCGLLSGVRALFEILRLSRVLTICASREDALHTVAAGLSPDVEVLPAITVPAAG
jgi:anti-sigma B factor antagonist